MSNLINHAKAEFLALGYTNKWIQESVLELIEVFSKQGHSGSSASFCIECFRKLALYKPLSPTKCNDSEWTDVGRGTFQNKRLSSVFKDGKEGNPYYIEAIVFRRQNGICFIGGDVKLSNGKSLGSSQFIHLPFTPKTFYIDVIETEWADREETVEKVGGGWWTSRIKDESQLKEVFEYYKNI